MWGLNDFYFHFLSWSTVKALPTVQSSVPQILNGASDQNKSKTQANTHSAAPLTHSAVWGMWLHSTSELTVLAADPAPKDRRQTHTALIRSQKEHHFFLAVAEACPCQATVGMCFWYPWAFVKQSTVWIVSCWKMANIRQNICLCRLKYMYTPGKHGVFVFSAWLSFAHTLLCLTCVFVIMFLLQVTHRAVSLSITCVVQTQQTTEALMNWNFLKSG